MRTERAYAAKMRKRELARVPEVTPEPMIWDAALEINNCFEMH